jgi:hypothetical protein
MGFSRKEKDYQKHTISDKFQIFNPVGTRMRNTTYFFLNDNTIFFLQIQSEYFFLNSFCIKSFFYNYKIDKVIVC